MSRAELARQEGLDRYQIAAALDQLRRQSLIVEGAARLTGRAGRPSLTVSLADVVTLVVRASSEAAEIAVVSGGVSSAVLRYQCDARDLEARLLAISRERRVIGRALLVDSLSADTRTPGRFDLRVGVATAGAIAERQASSRSPHSRTLFVTEQSRALRLGLACDLRETWLDDALWRLKRWSGAERRHEIKKAIRRSVELLRADVVFVDPDSADLAGLGEALPPDFDRYVRGAAEVLLDRVCAGFATV